MHFFIENLQRGDFFSILCQILNTHKFAIRLVLKYAVNIWFLWEIPYLLSLYALTVDMATLLIVIKLMTFHDHS